MTRGATRAAGVVVLCAALTTGCLSGGSCGSASSRAGALGRSVRAMIGASTASASCAEAVEFRHRLYVAWSRDLPVAKGRLLGDAVYPPCNDGGGCSPGDPDTAHSTEVWAMRGVDPHQVVIGRAQGTGELA